MALRTEGRYISVYAGGGGLDVGLHRALPSARCVCFVEIEAPAVSALVAAMEAGAVDEAPVWSDARTFDGRRFRGRVAGVIGGSPCPEFSVANPERKDTPEERLATDRGSLFFRLFGIAAECGAEWVLWENVGGAASSLPLMFKWLEQEGWRGAWTSLRASDVGASHERLRVFVLAHRDGARLGGQLSLRGTLGAHRGQAAQRVDMAMGQNPPGPDDLAAWGGIIRRFPHLAPSLPQPALRRVVDGLGVVAGGLGRIDLLRILGNGVSPEQSAAAIGLLWDYCASRK